MLKQGDAVLIRAKIVSVNGNQATVSLSSTDFAIVPLNAIRKSPPEKNINVIARNHGCASLND